MKMLNLWLMRARIVGQDYVLYGMWRVVSHIVFWPRSKLAYGRSTSVSRGRRSGGLMTETFADDCSALVIRTILASRLLILKH